jgi:hypothetical protein
MIFVGHSLSCEWRSRLGGRETVLASLQDRNKILRRLFKRLPPVGNEGWHRLSAYHADVHDLDIPDYSVDSGKIDSTHHIELLVSGRLVDCDRLLIHISLFR